MSTKYNPQVIQGKWHGRQYVTHQELGQGANGTVYLVRHQDHVYALKVGTDPLSITSEVNALRAFGEAQGKILGPSVYDIDDWEHQGKIYPFYVMNVIEGTPLPEFIVKRGKEWIPVLMMQLLTFLEQLHQEGWVFGDLKPDHLTVTDYPPKLAWFDAGGMTKLGRSIKEYTEAYDRGYWQMGNRKAEATYDLFSVGIIFLELYHGKAHKLPGHSKQELKQHVFQASRLYPYQPFIWRALTGRYSSAAEMKNDLVHVWHIEKGGKLEDREPRKLRRAQKKQKRAGAGKRTGKVITFFFFSSFVMFLFALLLYSQTLS